MTKVVEHQENDDRAELKMSYAYWRKMKVKLNIRLGKETRAMIVCYNVHKRLMFERKQLIAVKSPFNPVISLQLALNKLNTEHVNTDLTRHRAIVKALREQLAIAIDQENMVSDELEILSW